MSRRCPEDVQKVSRRLEKNVGTSRESSAGVKKASGVVEGLTQSGKAVGHTCLKESPPPSEQPGQSVTMKRRHCGLLMKACGPSGHSGHLLKLAKAPSGHLLKLAKAPSGHSGHSGANRKRAVSPPSPSDILALRPAIDGAVVGGPAMKTSKASARGRCRSWRSGMPPSPRAAPPPQPVRR